MLLRDPTTHHAAAFDRGLLRQVGAHLNSARRVLGLSCEARSHHRACIECRVFSADTHTHPQAACYSKPHPDMRM